MIVAIQVAFVHADANIGGGTNEDSGRIIGSGVDLVSSVVGFGLMSRAARGS